MYEAYRFAEKYKMEGWSQCSQWKWKAINNKLHWMRGWIFRGCRGMFRRKEGQPQGMNVVTNDGVAVSPVLPKPPNKPVVLFDNAKYHSRQTEESRVPTTAWRVGQIRVWLTSEGKPFDAKDTKPILLGKKMFLKNWQKNSVRLMGKTLSWFNYLSDIRN